jgi:simple sugar transport system permease protein
VALSYQAGLLNIGCEGQLTLGALTTATVAVLMPAEPGGLTTLAAVMAGSLMGGLWALPVIWLREKRGVHEVISSLLLNYVAIYLADYLVRGPLGDGTAMARTAEIPAAAAMVPWGQAGTAGITLAPFVALFLTLLFQVWVYRTTWGYEVRAIGINALAAARAGITVTRWSAVVFSGSGVLAGLAGALEVAAVHHRFYAAFSPGYGFDGIAVAFLVKGIPGWLWLSSLLLATLRAADKWLQIILDISPNAVLVIEAVILLAVTCQIHGGRLLERLHAVSISKTFREKP